jgi:hypothetical protein
MENGIMENGLIEKIERWVLLAEDLKEEGKKAFLKDIEDNIYFCEVLSSDDKKINFKCVGPPQRAEKIFELRWLEIKKFEEFNHE